MKPLLLSLLAAVSSLSLSAQVELPTYVFSLSADLAEQYYRQPTDTVDLSALGMPIDSFLREQEEAVRRPGHYLYLRPVGDQMELHLRSYATFQLKLRPHPRELQLEVINSEGQTQQKAKIQLDKQVIPYDETTHSYRLKRRPKDGLLRIQIDGETLFYQLTDQMVQPLWWRRFRYWQSSSLGYWLTTPLRIVENSFRYLHRGVFRGNWRFYRKPWDFLSRERSMRGYIAMSQPVYRPGDTLRLNAFLTRPGGRAWRQAVRLQVVAPWSSRSRSQIRLDTLMPPSSSGQFLLDWPIPDSLLLDETYRIEIEHPRRERWNGLRHRFQYADYELDEATFTLQLDTNEYYRGQAIELEVSGRDQNDQFIGNAEVRLSLLPSTVRHIYGDSLTIPDTLWTHRQVLHARQATKIPIPDSIFPAADMQLQLVADFTTAAGEQHQHSSSFSFHHQWEDLLLRIEGDSLLAEYRRQGRSVAGRAVLHRLSSVPLLSEPDSIRLPYRERLSPYIQQYILRDQQRQTTLMIDRQFASGVTISASWRADTILMQIDNPRQLPILWSLQDRARIVQEGRVDSPKEQIKLPVAAGRQWVLQYSYFWGSLQEDKVIIPRVENLLDIQVEQPGQIAPGAMVDIRIKVHDQQGRPARGVRLAAAGINAQFEDRQAAYRPPDLYTKPGRRPFRWTDFRLQRQDQQQLPARPVNRRWYQRLDLSRYVYYRMRFDNSGSFTYYDDLSQDTFYQNVAQVAPYLFHDRAAIPVYLIYINGGLVYYHGVDNDPPYSLVGRAGYNRLNIRTREAEYQLDSVWLAPGQKLELAIDVDRFRSDSSGLRLSRTDRPDYWTGLEKRLITKSMLILHREQSAGEQYFWDRPDNIHRLSMTGRLYHPAVIGPLTPQHQVNYVRRGGWSGSFHFEPGFRYKIDPKRDRLYEHTLFPNDRPTFLPKYIRPVFPGQYIYRPEDIRENYPTVKTIPYDRPGQARKSGFSRVQFLSFSTKIDSTAILANLVRSATGEEWVTSPDQPIVGELTPGPYQLYCLLSDGRIAQRRLYLHTNTVHVINMQSLVFQYDPQQDWLKDIQSRQRRGAKPADHRGNISVTAPHLRYNPYEGTGQLYQGQVTDADGEPLIGASILINGTTTGTVTDIDGFYELWGPPGSRELIISYAGFASQSVLASPGFQQISTLQEESNMLEEVVVSGLGIARQAPDRDTWNLLQGQVAGISTGGMPEFAFPLPANLPWSGSIRDQFRDNAFWQPNLLTDQNGEVNFRVRYPDNITAWQTYALGMDHRRRAGMGAARTLAQKSLVARLSLPRFAIAGDEIEITGQALNYRPDTLAVTTFFQQQEQVLQSRTHELADALVDHVDLQVAPGQDSLSLTYGLKYEQEIDGEERTIAVLPPGSLVTEGHFLVLDRDTSLRLIFSEAAEPITLLVADHQLELLLEDLDYLRHYPYDCIEQTASRLMALALEKRILEQLGRPFTGERDLRLMRQRLIRNRRSDGAWGWWPHSEPSIWITLHAMRALQMSDLKQDNQEIEASLRYLVSELPGLQGRTLLEALDRLTVWRRPPALDQYLEAAAEDSETLYEQLMLTRIRQRLGLPYQLDTLEHYRQSTLYGAYFWKDNTMPGLDRTIALTLVAYDILKAAGKDQEAVRVRQYFLESRGIGSPQPHRAWYNTYLTAQVLVAIVPDLILENPDRLANQLRITSAGQSAHIHEFPHRSSWSGLTEMDLDKTGAGPLYITAYRQYHDPQPEPRTDLFQVTTSLWQNERPVEKLEQGQLAKLEVTVEQEQDAEYVLIEIPIPAACSYADEQAFRSTYESHRAYERDRVAIFCARLPAGKHRFYVNLEPRFRGRFTLNPVRVEPMYFPVLDGRNGMKQVIVR